MIGFARRFLLGLAELFFIHGSPAPIEPSFIAADLTAVYRKALRPCRLDGVFCAFAYSAAVRKRIRAFKFGGNRAKTETMEPFLESLCRKYRRKAENGVVVWVPSDWFSRLLRAYEPNARFAQTAAQALGLECLGALKKVKRIPKQSRLPRSERLRNPMGAFQIRLKYAERIRGKTVWLFDDVIATGATADEAAKVLKECGAEKVFVVALAVSEDSLR